MISILAKNINASQSEYVFLLRKKDDIFVMQRAFRTTKKGDPGPIWKIVCD